MQPDAVLDGHGGLLIGEGVRIATHAVSIPANDVFDDTDAPIRVQGETRVGIRIEDDVWIGANAVVLDGCVVGKGSVVAAGAVVTGDVAPYSVVGGIPARGAANAGSGRAERCG